MRDEPSVTESHHTAVKSWFPRRYSSYGRPAVLPYPCCTLVGSFDGAPPAPGTAKKPCWNVLGVRLGPAYTTPDITHASPVKTVGLDVPLPLPQYHCTGSSTAAFDAVPVLGEVGGRFEKPKACAHWSW